MFKYCGVVQYFLSESETVDTLPAESKPQKVIAEWAGCLQSALVMESWLEGESVAQKAPKTGRMASGLSNKGSFIRSRMRLGSVNQAHHAQACPGNGQHHKRFTWAKEKKSWFVAQWPKVFFLDESSVCILIWNQGPRVRRKCEEAQNPSCFKSSVVVPQLVMI